MVIRVRLTALVLVVCALSGCGVDSTRALWTHAWVPPTPPAHGRLLWRSEQTVAFGAKGVITPAALTADVLTDHRVWEGVGVVVADVAVNVAIGWLFPHGHGPGVNLFPHYDFTTGFSQPARPAPPDAAWWDQQAGARSATASAL
jgi:hypothetical protein